MAKTKQTLTPAAKMLKAKLKLIDRLHTDIANVRADADAEIKKIQARIKVAEALAKALNAGSLKF